MSSNSDTNRRRPHVDLLLAVLAVAVVGCGSESGGGASTGSRRNSALLITLDTTRADAIGFQRAGPSVTPRLDELAREGVVFERAYTVAPITLPAHASMLSGLYPPRSSVRQNGVRPLPESAETVAERARNAGFQTAAFVGAAVLDRTYGLDQGFDVYDVPAVQSGGLTTHFDERPAGQVIEAASAWLRERDRERPFFVWVHLFDPHAPYAPPPAYRVARFRNSYLGEVAYADTEIGRLLDGLRAEGVLDETTVLFVADHGEAFGEHDELSHATYCYEPTLHVPMLLRRSDRAGAGTRTSVLASVADAHPTLVEAMGLTPTPELDGVSLYGLKPPVERGIYFESYYAWFAYGWSPLAGWLDDKGKYLHSSTPQFFDVQADPGETRDLVGERDVRAYRDAIAAVAARPSLVLDASSGVDSALIERIRGLGYVGMDDIDVEIPHPLAPTYRPSPASRSREHHALMKALAAGNRQDWAESEALCETVLATDPGNPEALEQFSLSRIQQGDYAGAIAPLQELLQDGGDRADLIHNLAISYWRVGRLEEAAVALRRAGRLAPNQLRVLESLAQVLRAMHQELEAEAVERDLRALRSSRGDQ